MAVSETNFASAIADLYETVLGPYMFEPAARLTAARLAGFEGDVLEVAAGTGIVTRELDRSLAPGARLTATDLNPPMLEVAAARTRSPRVAWRQADAMALPFADAAFDAVVSQYGVMFYPDQVAGHREAWRVLRPGGRYLLGVWDDLAGNPVAEIVHNALAARFPDDPPLFFARTPHGHADTGKHVAALSEAGFTDIAVETATLDAGRFAAERLALGFCQGTPLRHEIVARAPTGLDTATAAVADALRARFGPGEFDSTIRTHLITGLKDAPPQGELRRSR